MTAPPDRPLTRARRLTRWVPTPRRAWRAAKRRPKTAALLLAAAAGVCVAVFPHVRAAWAGHVLRYRGHPVRFGHYLDETVRRYAPLPTGSPLWTTPVAVSYQGDNRLAGTPRQFVGRLAAMPHVSYVGFTHADLNKWTARRAAARHSDIELSLRHCTLDPGALRAFTKNRRLVHVRVTDGWLPPGEFAPLADAPGLQGMELQGSTGVGGGLAPLAGHPTLWWVVADGSDLNDESFAALLTCPKMARVDARRTDVTDAGLAALNGRGGPAGVMLSSTRVTDAGLAALTACPGLGRLELNRTAVTDAGVAAVARACPNLSVLTLAGTAVTDACLGDLTRLEDLILLDLSDTAVTDAVFDAAAAWPADPGLVLSPTVVPDPLPPGWTRDGLSNGDGTVTVRRAGE